ncbi:von Willebrand factor type A domain-containing protein [Streptomyces sp. NPDC086091]|uniref:vWA domain-containing protein n=1 Tax=Streptomyces sp. NPDC086091 TaxID=3365751 RepID=UPI00382875EF
MSETNHRTRRLPAATAAALALLLTACGDGGGDADHSGAADRSGGDSGRQDGFPAPAYGATGQGTDERRDFTQEDDEARPAEDLLSTFALDVDTASYGYARRTLADGGTPDPATIRPEEFVNSFRQDYDRPDGDGFSITVDGARTGDDDWSLVRVGLATRTAGPVGERPPAALTFVIDISGSMAEPGRLDLARRALGTMTDRLRADDSVALVAFSDEAETVLPMTRLGDRRARARIHDAIDSLEPTDSTDLGAGVRTGYATAVEGLREGATNRVVLISDALANTGDTDAHRILDRVEDARRTQGITLFGVGVGSDYGDALMERLADRGDGHTTYVSDDADADRVFSEELPRHVDLTARDAKAQVAFDPRTVDTFRLIGYDNRRVADEDFRDDRVDGGEVGPGHTVTALYAVRTRPGATGHLATATVRWLDPATRAPHEASGPLETDALHEDLTAAPARFQVAATAAYFAEALRGDTAEGRPLPDTPTLDGLAATARALARRTEDPQVRDLADTIDLARRT